MKYLSSSTWGKSLECSMKPYKKVINNGCTIETQDEHLLQQLAEDEKNRISNPINWWLFKVGETVLIDNRNVKYACTMNNNGHWIRLDRIME